MEQLWYRTQIILTNPKKCILLYFVCNQSRCSKGSAATEHAHQKSPQKLIPLSPARGMRQRDVIAGDFRKSRSRVGNFNQVLLYSETMKKNIFTNNFEIIYLRTVKFKISTILEVLLQQYSDSYMSIFTIDFPMVI